MVKYILFKGAIFLVKGIFDFIFKYKYLIYLGCALSAISKIIVLVAFICMWKISYEIIKVFPNGQCNYKDKLIGSICLSLFFYKTINV